MPVSWFWPAVRVVVVVVVGGFGVWVGGGVERMHTPALRVAQVTHASPR